MRTRTAADSTSTYLDAIELDVAVDDETASFIDRVGEVGTEDENVDTALDLAEHERADGCERVASVVLHALELTLGGATAAGHRGELEAVVAFSYAPTGPDVGERGREVPALEGVLVNEVAVVGADERLGRPARLEQRLTRRTEVDARGLVRERAPPEVVQVHRVPALFPSGSILVLTGRVHATGIERTMRGMHRLMLSTFASLILQATAESDGEVSGRGGRRGVRKRKRAGAGVAGQAAAGLQLDCASLLPSSTCHDVSLAARARKEDGSVRGAVASRRVRGLARADVGRVDVRAVDDGALGEGPHLFVPALRGYEY
jgi:hypothetical protein